MEKKLDNLLKPQRNELRELQKLYKETQKQIDDAVEQGNDTLLELQQEYGEMVERKKQLLREIEGLEDRLKIVKGKIGYAENTYGKYLNTIREGMRNETEV